jgi:hypothetical protein
MASKTTRSTGTKRGGRPAVKPCDCCGIAPGVDGKPLSITFELPDVYHEIPPELLDVWGEDPFLAIKTIGFFVRVIVPVKLDGGFAANIGTWLEVRDEDFRTAWQTWNAPEYKDLEIEGYLANIIEPWTQFPHALVKATVVREDEVPVITSATHPDVQKFLETEWKHAWVFEPYAAILRADLPAPLPEGTATK